MIDQDPEHTLTSHLSSLKGSAERLLTLTILWHPQLERVGEQAYARPGSMEMPLNRFAPLFARPGGSPLALGDRRIARDPVMLLRDAADQITIVTPQSRMSIEVDGRMLTGASTLAGPAVERGVVLALGGAVLLCLHWSDQLPRLNNSSTLLGVSGAVLRMHELIRQAAGTQLPVLLLGETGTGKEVAAHAIHTASARRERPLVAVNMATLSDTLAAADMFGAVKGAYTGAQNARRGWFAEAGDGTVFLDEIGNTPVSVQPMLLRVLETGQYRPLGAPADVKTGARVIAATDQDLGPGFNQALLRRLEGFVIRLPPLRERREDIGLLIRHMMEEWERAGNAPAVLPVALVDELCRYDWPGNVRQLAMVVRRALIGAVAGEPLPFEALVPDAALDADATVPLGDTVRAVGRRVRLSDLDHDAVLAALEGNGWRVGAAAQALGVSRPSMYKLIDDHPGIRAPAAIPLNELNRVVAEFGDDIARCAQALKTPSEALRRHLRGVGLLG
ncbi:two-component system, NtrC family, nitrogen regulation response regulator GlnG [Duganella sp. CF517]|uniref:sigma 54-interacting transcriptional regulator n=1 Tax=Duganella sp. CF517 TaxID=1881038 RepID=UPI0008CF10CF|nr:sigma 54-interacting transcriptional regulator [Duganella sp. CF517]SEN77105.1 two-component system, NtrC family, nitrogen regulation response regulator GlnG [Duganella sp. CF517]